MFRNSFKKNWSLLAQFLKENSIWMFGSAFISEIQGVKEKQIYSYLVSSTACEIFT